MLSSRSRPRPSLMALAMLTAVACAGCGSAVSGSAEPAGSAVATVTGSSAPLASGDPSPSATPYQGRVVAIGDSVMLGAATCLQPRGIKVDADESRSFPVGADLLRTRAEADRLPDRVVVHMGTNGPIATEDIAALADDLDGHEVYWINVHLPDVDQYYYAADVNASLAEVAAKRDNLHVIDWDAAAREHPGWLYPDGTHLTPKGCDGFARMVDTAVREPLPVR